MMLAPLLALAALAAPPPPPDPRVTLLAAMEQEASRSMQRLHIAGYEPPFFLSYQLKDLRQEEVNGRFGAVIDDGSRHDRRLYADVRVGSYELDSSGRDPMQAFLGEEGQTWSAPRDAPLDDDPQALRNALWLVTDEKYKEALSSYFKKKSKGVYRAEDTERAPSFTREPPQRQVDPPRAFSFDRPRWRAEVRRLTALFREHPTVFEASVKVTGEKQVRWFTSSEGAALVTEEVLFGVHVQAVARAEDGQLLENSRDFYARSEAALPDAEKLAREVRALILELEALRVAPVVDPYTGPAILAPEATGVLFHEAVGHRLEGERQDDDKEGQTFKGQIGKPVLPAFVTIADDPTLRAAGEVALNGSYAYDDQGVPARRTVLVEDGVLRTFLLSRRPVKPFTRSNGHGRSQGALPPVARMGNLVVSSRKQVPMTELRRLLVEEAKRQGKPYGLVIQDITGGNTNTMSYGYQAFKGTPRLVYRVDVATGKQELVRGVELVGTPLSSINKLLATGDELRAFNGFCGAESGYVPVSTVAPAVLIGEIELQRVARANERSPILPAPWNEGPRP
ncbi:MAG TPA: metallopeptidase TldD-related protein [Anaeromyxobacteraceae bacterium]|nr:metallopeptidase TldD-related protein [Anaeromyxobacteraceae bacterium]